MRRRTTIALALVGVVAAFGHVSFGRGNPQQRAGPPRERCAVRTRNELQDRHVG